MIGKLLARTTSIFHWEYLLFSLALDTDDKSIGPEERFSPAEDGAIREDPAA